MKRRKSRRSLTAFKEHLWPKYARARHQDAIDAHLMEVARYIMTGGSEGIGRLMIFMPPRHGKTQTASRYFPAWLLGQMPTLRVMTTSYGASLAESNSYDARKIVAREEYRRVFPDTELAPDSTAVANWRTSVGGGMYAAGVGGSITGQGGQLLIVDDPVRGRAEAESATYRDTTADWYANDLLTRLEQPGGAIVLMMTRWHTDDLAGSLLADGAERWQVLKLPALAEENDPLGRQPGEALWPERYSAELLAERRAEMGEYAFSSLYQQRPIPAGGGLFDTSKIELLDLVPNCKYIVRFYDLAVTAKASADYTVGLKLGILDDETLVVLDVWRAQKEAPDVYEAIVQNAHIDGTHVKVRLEAEKAGIMHLQSLLRDPRMRGYIFDAKPPQGDKYTRATPVATRVNAGRLKLVRATWNRAFIDELSHFPRGAHDDQVDALSGAYGMLATARPGYRTLA